MAAATAKGFRSKAVDLAEYSDSHRTTLGHFPAEGKWDKRVLQTKVKTELERRPGRRRNVFASDAML